MDVISIWLVYHKAALAPDSPMNLDGSDYMVGVGVVPAVDITQALSRFEEYLSENKMTIVEVTKCEQWEPSNFADGSFESKRINDSARAALDSNTIHYPYGESSESLEDDDD